jgi:hypothetical protein
MYVNRRTFISVKGKHEEVAAQIKEGLKSWPQTSRVYVSNLGTFDLVSAEVEFESLAEFERVWSAMAAAATPEWWAKWNSITQTGGTNEIWELR